MSLKRYIAIGIVGGLWSCDAVVNKDTIFPEEPQIPQAVVESVRAINPNMSDVNLTRMANGELWQADFPSAMHRNLLLIDDSGEILFENQLVGKPQQLPVAVRNEANRIAQQGFIESASVIQRDAQTPAGFLVEVKMKNGQLRTLRFNSNNVLETDVPAASPGRTTNLYLTTTEQIREDARIPAHIRQFFAQNQFSGAHVVVYVYEDQTAKIVLTNYQLTNKSVTSTEILLAADGKVLEWIAPLEKEISYEVTAQNETPAQLNALMTAQAPGWTWEYSVRERRFGKEAQWTTRGKNAGQELFRALADDRTGTAYVLKTSVISANDVPVAVRQYLDSQWNGWQWSKGRKLQQTDKNIPEKYVVEVKINADTYVALFDGSGKWLYQYKKSG